ncbi:MAG: alpha-L-fucosidase [bacterium]
MKHEAVLGLIILGMVISTKGLVAMESNAPAKPSQAAPAFPVMPAYQFPPEPVCIENANRWKWMKAFYEQEVSRPASPNETLDQIRKRSANVRPSPAKLAYMDMEFITFPHFIGPLGDSPAAFNPKDFDARQWVQAHKKFGAKMIVCVAKHHNGFYLWRTKLNGNSVCSAPWRGGKGDMVKELADACREAGLKFGVYISIWDHNDPRCDTTRKSADQMLPERRKIYQDYVEQQLLETLIPYGEISEIWFDGAGTNGAEDWNRIFEIIYTYQPKCIVAMCGFGNRWCGNESAIGDAINWNVLPILPDMRSGKWTSYHFEYLIPKRLHEVSDNLESMRGKELFWSPQEGDTCVLMGNWGWDGKGEPRSLQFLIDTWYASIGSGAVLIVSPGPHPDGAITQPQIDRLCELKNWIDESFRNNVLNGARITLTPRPEKYDPAGLLRVERDQPWITLEPAETATLEAEFPEPRTFNNILLEEYQVIGQRISSFSLEAWRDGKWVHVTDGRTVGHKRALPFAEITATKVRIKIEARANPALRFAGLFKALPYGSESEQTFQDKDFLPAVAEPAKCRRGLRYSYFEDANNGYLPFQEMFDLKSQPDDRLVDKGFTENPLETVKKTRDDRKRQKHWAMKFDGYLRAPVRAVYTFRIGANSGCRLYIDGQPLIKNDESGALGEGGKRITASVPLDAGLHRITALYYFGVTGDPRLSWLIEWPGSRGGIGFGWSVEQRLLELLCCEADK